MNGKDIIKHLQERKMLVPEQIPHCKLEDAENVFKNVFSALLEEVKRKPIWKKGYDDVVSWISDNERKGIFLLGNCSLGKTFITSYVIPAVFSLSNKSIIRTYNLNKLSSEDFDKIIKSRRCVIDDIGTESIKNDYGNKTLEFAEIVDNAEKKGNLLILSSNLTGDEIKKKYGIRVYERLNALVKIVVIEGQSER